MGFLGILSSIVESLVESETCAAWKLCCVNIVLKPITSLIVLFTLHFPLSTPENLNAADQFFSLFICFLGLKIKYIEILG